MAQQKGQDTSIIWNKYVTFAANNHEKLKMKDILILLHMLSTTLTLRG